MSFESSFRALDIRGKWPEDLNEENAMALRRALLSFCTLKDNLSLLQVTHDGRAESKKLAEELRTYDNPEISSTPSARIHSVKYSKDIGPNLRVHVTCSHNPSGWTGMKMFINGDPLSDEDWDLFKALALRPLKIVVTGFNGCMGTIALAALDGLNLVPFMCEENYDFKDGVPNPEDPHLMSLLSKKVLEEKADLGIAFDGDGDRLGVVDEKGNVVPADQLGLFFIKREWLKYFSTNPDPDFVCDMKCSAAVDKFISEGRLIRTKTGYKFIIEEAKRCNALFAFERSGHFFWKEHYYIDDGIYAAKKLIAILQKRDDNKKLSEILPPVWYNEGVLNISYSRSKEDVMLDVTTDTMDVFKKAKFNYLDGVEIRHDDYRVLIRSSNNISELVVIIETKNEDKLYYSQLKDKVLQLLKPIVA